MFRSYNEAIWPWQGMLIATAVAMVVVARFASSRSGRLGVAVGLAALWAWTGAVYQPRFFSPINPAARVFATLFF